MMKRQTGLLAVLALLSACGVTPIQQDQPVYLEPGHGLVAIVTDTLDPITQVTVESQDGKTTLNVPSVPTGSNIYMFPTPAGHYCFTRFQYGNWHFFGKQGDLGCFEVKAGELAYSGTLAPRVENDQVMTHQIQAPETFRALLKQRYPIIAKQFLPSSESPTAISPAPAAASAEVADESMAAGAVDFSKIAPKQPPEAGKDQISSWAEQLNNGYSQVVFVRNNTQWTMQVVDFQLYDCVGVKQTCGVQRKQIVLPPHATRVAVVVDPADPHGAYAYRTYYIYGFMPTTPAPAPKKPKKH